MAYVEYNLHASQTGTAPAFVDDWEAGWKNERILDYDAMDVDLTLPAADRGQGSLTPVVDTVESEGQQCLTPIARTAESTSAGAYTNDINLQYLDHIIPCDSSVLGANSGVFRHLIKNMDLTRDEDEELPVLVIPPYELCQSYDAFSAVLESIYTEGWTFNNVFETQLSFLTCVKMYLIGEHWDIEGLRASALNTMTAGSASIMRKPNRLLAAAELDAQHVHMMSFVQALRLASRRDWHAKLWRELYNCGEDMAPKLRQSPNFRVWVAGFQDGKDFARAIGIRDM